MKLKYFLGPGVVLIVLLVMFTIGAEENPEDNPKIYNDLPDEEEFEDFKATLERQAKEYPDTIFLRGDTGEDRVALTFDDGPDKINTPRILDILKENDIKATFFVIGQAVEEFPDVSRRIIEEGHQIANHSWSHPNYSELDNEKVLNEELLPTSEKIAEVTGIYPQVMRPPFGAINDETIEFLENKDWQIVNWSLDSVDWHYAVDRPEEIVSTIEKHHHPGAIILLHNGIINQITVEALPDIIEVLQSEGYDFTTVEEILS